MQGNILSYELFAATNMLKFWNKTVEQDNIVIHCEVQHTGITEVLDETLTDEAVMLLVFAMAIVSETAIGASVGWDLPTLQGFCKGVHDSGAVRIRFSGTDGISDLTASMENLQAAFDETHPDYNEFSGVGSMPMGGRDLQSNKFDFRIYWSEDENDTLANMVFGGGSFMQRFYTASVGTIQPGAECEIFSTAELAGYFGIMGMDFTVDDTNNIVLFPKIASFTPYTIETRVSVIGTPNSDLDYTVALIRPDAEIVAKDTENVKLGSAGTVNNNSNVLQTYTDGSNDRFSIEG